MTIEEYWKNSGSPKFIFGSDNIETFLNKWIELTNGNTNLDSIHNAGFADNIKKVDRYDNYYLIYWKDFKDVFDKKKMSDDENMHLQVFGGFTYIYYLISIRKIEIINTKTNGLTLVLHSNYISEKEAISFLRNIFNFNESYKSRDYGKVSKNIVFIDNSEYIHNCEVNVMPLSSMLLVQKKKAWSAHTSRMFLIRASLLDIVNPIINIKNELYLLEDKDEYRIRECVNDIRFAVEGLTKFYFILLTMEKDYNFEERIDYPQIFKNLMKSFGSLKVGNIVKQLKIDNAKVIPKEFVIKLNEYSHYSGKYPNKIILVDLIEQYDKLLNNLFDLETFTPKT